MTGLSKIKSFLTSKRTFGLALLVVALALAPFLVGVIGGNAWVRILDFALLYVMLALGLNIVVGFAGLLDLGYIAFYAVGAYVYALLASSHFSQHFSAWMILPIGASLACCFGALLGAPTLKLRGDYLAIVTLGFGEIVRLFMNNLDRPVNITNGPQGISMIDPVQVAGYPLSSGISLAGQHFAGAYAYYYLFLACTVVVVGVCMRLENSRLGRAWVAIREDEVAAKAMGINTRNVKLLAFAMGASFGGVAGGLFSGFQAFVSPESFTLMESVMVLCMVVLGGMGHIPGVILGAVLLTITPEILRDVITPLQRGLFGRTVVDPENLRMVLFGLALVLVMLYRPAGLWPSARRREELEGE